MHGERFFRDMVHVLHRMTVPPRCIVQHVMFFFSSADIWFVSEGWRIPSRQKSNGKPYSGILAPKDRHNIL